MNPTFITGNAHKVKYLRLWLDQPLEYYHLDLTEIQSLDLKAVVTHKVTEAFEHLRRPVLVEDVSLTFQALGRLPGPLIKWFLTELGTDGLCRLLSIYPDRSATAETMYGLHDGRTIHYFTDVTHGQIALQPRGELGFGWNAIFVPNGSDKTYGEMNDAELKNYSHRAKALDRLSQFLESYTDTGG